MSDEAKKTNEQERRDFLKKAGAAAVTAPAVALLLSRGANAGFVEFISGVCFENREPIPIENCTD